MKTTIAPVKITGSSASFTWRIHQHHGWKTLHSSYCDTRAEFDAECDRLAEDEASNSSDSPSLLSREDYLDSDYYSVLLQPATVAAVCISKNDVREFTSEAEAQAAYQIAMRDHGYARLLCDIGNHAGQTDVVDVEDITIRLAGFMTFTAPDDTHKFTVEEITEGLGERDDVAEIVAMLNDRLRQYA